MSNYEDPVDQNMEHDSEPSDELFFEVMEMDGYSEEIEIIDLTQDEVDDGEEVIDLTQEEVDVVEDAVENDEEEHEVEEQSEHLTQHVDCPKCFVLQDMLTGELQYDDSEHRNQHVDCLKCLEIN